jgi:hypothetical protein
MHLIIFFRLFFSSAGKYCRQYIPSIYFSLSHNIQSLLLDRRKHEKTDMAGCRSRRGVRVVDTCRKQVRHLIRHRHPGNLHDCRKNRNQIDKNRIFRRLRSERMRGIVFRWQARRCIILRRKCQVQLEAFEKNGEQRGGVLQRYRNADRYHGCHSPIKGIGHYGHYG